MATVATAQHMVVETAGHEDKVFTLEDTYPERFFKWADDFIHYIR